MGRYEDFNRVTLSALEWCCESLGLEAQGIAVGVEADYALSDHTLKALNLDGFTGSGPGLAAFIGRPALVHGRAPSSPARRDRRTALRRAPDETRRRDKNNS